MISIAVFFITMVAVANIFAIAKTMKTKLVRLFIMLLVAVGTTGATLGTATPENIKIVLE